MYIRLASPALVTGMLVALWVQSASKNVRQSLSNTRDRSSPHPPLSSYLHGNAEVRQAGQAHDWGSRRDGWRMRGEGQATSTLHLW